MNTTQSKPQTEKSLSIDIGYGDVKVIGDGKSSAFLSGYAPFSETDIGFGHAYGLRIVIPEKSLVLGPVIVGDRARTYPNYYEPSGDFRLGSDEALPLLAQAILEMGMSGEIVLSTGAPLSLYKREKLAAKNWEGIHLNVNSTDGRSHSVYISKVVTRPQGVAAAIALVGRKLIPREPGIGLIVDVGSRTTDVVAISLETLDPIPNLCFSIQAGVATMLNNLSDLIANQVGGFPPQRAMLLRVMNKSEYTFSGRKVELLPLVEKARNAVAGGITHEIRRRLGAEIDQVIAVAGAGGGALPVLLGKAIRDIVPHIDAIILPGDGPRYLNVEGYDLVAGQLISAGLK